MITSGLNNKLTIVRFGYGMICITGGSLLDKKAYLDFQRCEKSEIGKDLPTDSKIVKDPRVRLLFNNVASLDALMIKLQDIRESMVEMENDKSTS